jgi:hypothetical protein
MAQELGMREIILGEGPRESPVIPSLELALFAAISQKTSGHKYLPQPGGKIQTGFHHEPLGYVL